MIIYKLYKLYKLQNSYKSKNTMDTNTLILIVCIIILLYVYTQSDCMKKMLEGYTVNKNGNELSIAPEGGSTEANPGQPTEYKVSCNNGNVRKLVLLNPLDVYTHQNGNQRYEEKFVFKNDGYNNYSLPTGVYNNVENAGLALCNLN